jgi:hypothetical protein
MTIVAVGVAAMVYVGFVAVAGKVVIIGAVALRRWSWHVGVGIVGAIAGGAVAVGAVAFGAVAVGAVAVGVVAVLVEAIAVGASSALKVFKMGLFRLEHGFATGFLLSTLSCIGLISRCRHPGR